MLRMGGQGRRPTQLVERLHLPCSADVSDAQHVRFSDSAQLASSPRSTSTGSPLLGQIICVLWCRSLGICRQPVSASTAVFRIRSSRPRDDFVFVLVPTFPEDPQESSPRVLLNRISKHGLIVHFVKEEVRPTSSRGNAFSLGLVVNAH